jgi:Uma2 family endonuclease
MNERRFEDPRMTTLLTAPPSQRTVADLLHDLGDISPNRVLLRPPPGTATKADVIALELRDKRLCELVDGVLVEKIMGFCESVLAGAILELLRGFVIPRNLGMVSGAAGMMRLFPGLVGIPDVAFVSWRRIEGGRMPSEPIPDLVPDLAVEVLSEGNTKAEMDRNRTEYFRAGVRLVWLVDPRLCIVTVYTEIEEAVVLDELATLDGGDVLPGFAQPLRQLFAELDRHATP